MQPPVKDAWVHATVMAVLWAILYSSWIMLMLWAFGRGFGISRLVAQVVFGAALVSILCATAFREGWKHRDEQGTAPPEE